MSWTDERINTLKKMWQAGKSASEIAEKLGGVTRNAVIGKAHRLGLSGRPSPIKKMVKKAVAPVPAKKAAPPPAAKTAQVGKTTAPAKQVAPAPKILPAKPPANSPGKPAEIVALAAMANMTSRKDGKLVSILELSEKICRWPVGDPKEAGFGYCGADAYLNHTYCAEHVAIAFQAPNRKDGKKIVKVLKPDEAPELEDLEVEVEAEEEAEDDVTLETDEEDDAVPVVV